MTLLIFLSPSRPNFAPVLLLHSVSSKMISCISTPSLNLFRQWSQFLPPLSDPSTCPEQYRWDMDSLHTSTSAAALQVPPFGRHLQDFEAQSEVAAFFTGGKSIERSSRWDPSLKCTLNGLFHFWLRGWTASLSCSKNTVKLCQLPQQCAMQITSSETSTDLA